MGDAEKINSASKFAQTVLSYSAGLTMNNETWRVFGYKKRPLLGAIPRLFKSKDEIRLIEFLLREVFCCCIANGLSANEEHPNDAKIASSIGMNMFGDDGIRRAFYGECKYEEAVCEFATNISGYIKEKDLSSVFFKHIKSVFGDRYYTRMLVQIPSFCTSELLFMMKVHIHENYRFPLIDDIEIDTGIVEEWINSKAV